MLRHTLRNPKLTTAALVAGGLVIGGFTVSGSALAATQGSMGATSQGDIQISAGVPDLVKISYLDDLSLGTFSGTGDLTGSDDVCVFSNNGGYNIDAAGSGTGNAFELTGGSTGSTVPYSVEWGNTAGAASGSAVTPSTGLTGVTGSFTTPSCQGGSSLNATLMVRISEADLSGAAADTYTGTLTLTVSPQ